MSAPAWYHGVGTPNKLAATIRDGYFALLGSTDGFPYGANLFFQAFFECTLYGNAEGSPVLGDPSASSPGLPLTLTFNLVDSSGNVAGTATVTFTISAANFSINGTFDATQDYTLQVEPLTTPGLNGGPAVGWNLEVITGGPPGSTTETDLTDVNTQSLASPGGMQIGIIITPASPAEVAPTQAPGAPNLNQPVNVAPGGLA